MACPFFYPVRRLENPGWVRAPRWPLGEVFSGECRVCTEAHTPEPGILQESCNRGYARQRCTRMPESAADAVRFSVDQGAARDRNRVVRLIWIREKDHSPLDHGSVELTAEGGLDPAQFPDPTLARQAQVYLETFPVRMPRKNLLAKRAGGNDS